MNKWLELFSKDDYVGIKKYLKNGGNLEETNDLGESVLMCALRARCDIDTIMLLIESGADVFEFDDEGVSVFDIAITYDYMDIVKYIMDKGIDINKTTRRSGFRPLMTATCYGRVDIVKLLLENGANKEIKDSKGFSSVDFARKMNKKTILELFEYDENSPKNTAYAR